MAQATANMIIGWREWGSLPELGIATLKVKVDTGARTSCLHATEMALVRRAGQERVRFLLEGVPGDGGAAVPCEAPVLDRRQVTDSGGHRELRWVIKTPVRIGPLQFPVECTLTDRSDMRFPMLLGRRAIAHRFLVDVAHGYLQGRRPTGRS